MIKMYQVITALSTSLLFLVAPVAFSTPITTDLDINASVAFDDDPSTGSFPVAGAATQIADINVMLGGLQTLSTIDNLSVTGPNPLAGKLTDTGDGAGVSARVEGDADAAIDGFFFDLAFDLSNLSATATYQVFFEINYANLINADGSDAYIDAEINLFDSSNNEVWFSDLTSDTFFGDEVNGSSLATFGDILSDNGTFGFNYTLSPGASDSFTGELSIDAADFGGDGFFSGQTSAFVSVARVVELSAPPAPVPAPATLLVLLTGLSMLLVFKRRPQS